MYVHIMSVCFLCGSRGPLCWPLVRCLVARFSIPNGPVCLQLHYDTDDSILLQLTLRSIFNVVYMYTIHNSISTYAFFYPVFTVAL